MGKILEFLTVNVATADIDGALGKFRAMGLETLPPAHMPEPPAEITDVTLPIGPMGSISVIAATGPGSPVKRFIDKRGEGIYSIAVRVDSLAEVMEEWAAAGLQWVLPEPYVFDRENPAARYVVEQLKVNWVKPSSLGGVMLECFEFVGAVREEQPE
ncbi:MAG: hypothetical protein HOH66_17000 [Rhodospirillaceae bacterium]|mgnify:FL=1|jgi:hypothetical protein|nr:hypothetical protein [Rhodospirillaceae bacterium]MBT6119562.1 hypothetical protein [Rhodospirillaceae bacterium]